MAFNLDGFINKHADFARGYTFYCSVTSGFVGDEFQKHLVKSSTLPSSSNPKASVNWQGNVYKIGTTSEYGEQKITYQSDIANQLRFNYLNWLKTIHDVETNLHGDPAAYVADVKLIHLSHTTGAPIMVYTLHKAWPTGIGEITLDYGTKDIASFDVTFEYQWFTTAAAE
jgi:hypothetical protein